MKKYVWLNLETGEFSNSWGGGTTIPYLPTKELLELAEGIPWKLIEFSCLNDEGFEFNNLMRIA